MVGIDVHLNINGLTHGVSSGGEGEL
jgi:hypothetical protein